MIDFQRIVEDVRSAAECTDADAVERLAESAADYAVAVEEVNSRLRRCDELLRKGLRTEAIELCERQPNLMEVVATLDSLDVAAWHEKLVWNRIAIPPALNLDVAADLNAAYSLEQPLAQTLGRHRRQALGRAPLAARIQTLRELARLDNANPVWPEDLREYECARHDQLRELSERAIAANDLTAVHCLTAEVMADTWIEPVPAPLRSRLQSAEQKLQQSAARAQLAELEPQLHDALAEFDEEIGLRLRAEWESCAQVVRLKPDDPLQQRASVALEWLDNVARSRLQEGEYRHAVAVLDQSLDENVGLAELERLYNAALRIAPLPEPLEGRYQTRIASLERSQSRRRRLIVGSTIAATLVVAAVTAAAVYLERQKTELARHSATLGDLLSAERLVEAKAYLDDLSMQSPRMSRTAELARLRIELERALSAEKARQEEFAAVLARANEAGVERPDLAALARAMEIARTGEEKKTAKELERQVSEVQQNMQQARDREFAATVDELARQLTVAEVSHPDQLEALVAELGKLADDLTSLEQQAGDISAGQHANAVVLRQRIAQSRLDADGLLNEQRRLPRLASAVANLDEYQSVLEGYVRDFPNSKRTVGLKQILAEELPQHRALAQWLGFVDNWRKAHSQLLSGSQAGQLATQAEELQKSQSTFSWAKDLQPRIRYLRAIEARSTSNEVAELKKLLTDRTISDVWMLQLADGQRFYFGDDVRPSAGTASVQAKYLVTFDYKTSKRTFEGGLFLPEMYGEAPQAVVAKRAMTGLAQLDKKPWEVIFLGICELVQQQKRMDPLVQILLIQRTLEIGSQGSPIIEELCARTLKTLQDSTIDLTVTWLDPRDEEANRQRRLAEPVVETMPRFAELRHTATERLAQYSTFPINRPRYVGCLLHCANEWQCCTPEGTAADGDLFILAAEGPRRIGRAENGRIVLGNQAPSAEGSLVFTQESQNK